MIYLLFLVRVANLIARASPELALVIIDGRHTGGWVNVCRYFLVKARKVLTF